MCSLVFFVLFAVLFFIFFFSFYENNSDTIQNVFLFFSTKSTDTGDTVWLM